MMFHGFLALGIALLVQAAAAPPSTTPTAAPTPQPLQTSERAAVLQALKSIILKEYVKPERRAPIAAELTRRERQGRYQVSDPQALAARIQEDLSEITRDGHMNIIFNPRMAARLNAPPGATANMEQYYAERARRTNHGIRELRTYPGNIRYLKIDLFQWVGPDSKKAYDQAMGYLAGGDALIIDLRGNGGGEAEAWRYLNSHFVEPNVSLVTSVIRGVKEDESRAEVELPAGRLTGKPLWVLADGKTASASEAFVYDVRHRRLGEIIGTKTAGAANHNDYYALPHGFVASISIGGPVHALTGGNWEGAGVTPDIESSEALDLALLRSTERMAATASEELKPMFERELRSIRERLAAKAPPPAQSVPSGAAAPPSS